MAYRAFGTDRILETAAAPGTGYVSLGGAVTGFRTFASVLATGDTCAYLVEGVDANGTPNGPWERGFGTLQAGPVLARTVVVDSSSGGGLVNFAGSVRIGVAPMSDMVIIPAPGGRLSVSSTTPVADGSGPKIYYLPYLHDKVPVWNGAGIQVVTIPAGLSLDASGLAAGTAWDIFGYAAGGNLALDPPFQWNTPTSRTAVNLAWSNGFLCKSNDPTRRFLGSFYVGAAGVVYDAPPASNTGQPAKRLLWNMYNRVPRSLYMLDSTATWTWNGASWRIIRGLVAPQGCVEVFSGTGEEAVMVVGALGVNNPANTGMASAIGVDGNTNIPDWGVFYNTIPNPCYGAISTTYSGLLGVGYHYLALLEYATTAGVVSNAGWNYGSCGLWGTARA